MMLDKLKTLFSKQKAVPSGLVSLNFRLDGVAIAYTPNPQNAADIVLCDFLPIEEVGGEEKLLSDYVKKNHLTGAACACVLQPSEYRLLQIESPNVPDSELAKASRFLVKDLIDFPLDDAVVDAFMIPKRFGKSEKVYVVVAHLDRLNHLSKIISSAGLDLQSVDIAASALRNLLAQVSAIEAGAVMLYVDNDRVNMLIVRENAICFVRHLDASFLDDKPDTLMLEVQRSIDYYQAQLAQTAPAKLFVTPELAQKADWILGELMKMVPLPVEILPVDESLNEEQRDKCLLAIGETKRKLVHQMLVSGSAEAAS